MIPGFHPQAITVLVHGKDGRVLEVHVDPTLAHFALAHTPAAEGPRAIVQMMGATSDVPRWSLSLQSPGVLVKLDQN